MSFRKPTYFSLQLYFLKFRSSFPNLTVLSSFINPNRTPRIQRPRCEFDCVISSPPFLISSPFSSILCRPFSELYLTMTKPKSKMKGKISEQPTPPENDIKGTLQADLRLPPRLFATDRPTSELNLRDADASSSSAFGRTTFLELMSWIVRNVDKAYVLGFLLISLKTLK
ncbi:hypothetical protein HID58_087776 [Brassica napus]|uniref:BnaC09g31240D protein n=2 Tax=Brassica napus TaxID=3708 RepID=A0A078G564_BRANA|nr:hypothetical protein HID58_087776 [Brassica napus]CAF1760245.1 unnamed protein product [Brassica napus]CDY19858.1 BnaC09g31240D [Brassica napus]